MTRVTVLAGGVGGARFVRGLREVPDLDITVVANTGDDLWLAGLRVCPDLDSIMYTLGGANDEQRGWGRLGESERVSAELTAYGVGWPWFTLGDLDLGTHIARSSMLRDGLRLTEATARLTARWNVGVTLLPATDDEVETHVETSEGVIHFEEWWVRHRAALPVSRFIQRGIENSRATDDALAAITDADVVLLAPSNPVVSIGTILALPGVRSALEAAAGPVVGVSPIIRGSAVRGMAGACLTAIGVDTTAAAVALHYGSRGGVRGGVSGGGVALRGGVLGGGGVLDGWLLDDADAASVPTVAAAGITCQAAPLWMRDVPTSTAIAEAALELAGRLSA